MTDHLGNFSENICSSEERHCTNAPFLHLKSFNIIIKKPYEKDVLGGKLVQNLDVS
jgi:hypothetical protein